jgi:hypothetical protein
MRVKRAPFLEPRSSRAQLATRLSSSAAARTNRMALMLTEEAPANVVQLTQAEAS